MIIDFHTHLFPPNFTINRREYLGRDLTFASMYSNDRSTQATVEKLIANMDHVGIDKSVIMGIGWTDIQVAIESNNYIADLVAKFPDRLIGFCSVNPGWGQKAISEIERCVTRGIRGIGELHPDTQRLDITDKVIMGPIMNAALSMKLPLLVHSSEPVGHIYPGKGNTTPDKLYKLASNFPDNVIVFAHWGGGLPFYSLMPEVKCALSNVFYDMAASPLLYSPDVIREVVSLEGSNKILFGSDFPLIGQERVFNQVMTSNITNDQKARILGLNALPLVMG